MRLFARIVFPLFPLLAVAALRAAPLATAPLPLAAAMARPIEAQTLAGLSLDAAIAMVEQRFGARVVRADTQEAEGQTIYVLRLLNGAGRVWTVRVNAATGAVQ